MPMLMYGNHRAIACIILHRRGQLPASTVIGEQPNGPLTVGDLVDLYEKDQLTTGNSNYRGIPWFDDNKVMSIVQGLDLSEMFNPSRDGGRGVVLVNRGGHSAREMKSGGGYGISLSAFIRGAS